MKDSMILFWGGPFSNFHKCKFKASNHEWSSSEQYFMYLKAMYFEDKDAATIILNDSDPLACKRAGRKVKEYIEADWIQVREGFMYIACYNKFDQNESLKKILIETGDKTLAEASPYDRIWGIGLNEDNPDAYSETKWKGQNLLGKILMRVRSDIIHKDLFFCSPAHVIPALNVKNEVRFPVHNVKCEGPKCPICEAGHKSITYEEHLKNNENNQK